MINLIKTKIEIGSDGDVTDHGVNFFTPNNEISSERMDHIIDALGVRISTDKLILITHKGKIIRLGRYKEYNTYNSTEDCDGCIYFNILRCISEIRNSVLGCYRFPCCVDGDKNKTYKTKRVDHINLFTISKYKSQKDILIIDINKV